MTRPRARQYRQHRKPRSIPAVVRAGPRDKKSNGANEGRCAFIKRRHSRIWPREPVKSHTNPESGDIIPGSAVCRKVRWAASGWGKRGGARVIHFIAPERTTWSLIAYKKAQFDNLPTSFLADLKQGVEDVL